MQARGGRLKTFWGSTLYHLDDLPFTLPAMPATYGAFRERVVDVPVRKTVPRPSRLKGLPATHAINELDPGEVPTLEALGVRVFHQPKNEVRGKAFS